MPPTADIELHIALAPRNVDNDVDKTDTAYDDDDDDDNDSDSDSDDYKASQPNSRESRLRASSVDLVAATRALTTTSMMTTTRHAVRLPPALLVAVPRYEFVSNKSKIRYVVVVVI